MQLQRVNSTLLYTAGCPEPYYISLSRLLAIHVSHQLSKLWRVCTAVYLKVVSASDSTCTQYCRRSALYKLLCMYVCTRAH